MTIDIDTLTIGQLKEIKALACGLTEVRAPGVTCLKCTQFVHNHPEGRAILVVDRGWIFAGDLSLAADGYVRVTRAVNVFGWESIGFAKMVEDWKNPKVDLRPVADVEIPPDCIIFRVPVVKDWGLK
jgi:hypothetical protein